MHARPRLVARPSAVPFAARAARSDPHDGLGPNVGAVSAVPGTCPVRKQGRSNPRVEIAARPCRLVPGSAPMRPSPTGDAANSSDGISRVLRTRDDQREYPSDTEYDEHDNKHWRYNSDDLTS